MRYFLISLGGYPNKDLDWKVITSIDDDLIKMMEIVKEELRWDDMYDLEEVQKRFNDGCFCCLYFENGTPLGIVWFYDVRPHAYAFNWFMSKRRKVKRSSLLWNDGVSNHLKRMGYETWFAYTEDWNDKAYNMVKRFKGFKDISVHVFNEMIKGARKKTYF